MFGKFGNHGSFRKCFHSPEGGGGAGAVHVNEGGGGGDTREGFFGDEGAPSLSEAIKKAAGGNAKEDASDAENANVGDAEEGAGEGAGGGGSNAKLEAKPAPEALTADAVKEMVEKMTSERFGAARDELARRDRELASKELELKKAMDEASRYKRIASLSKEKPLEVLQELGIDPTALGDEVARGEHSPTKYLKKTVDSEISAVREEVEKMRAESKELSGILTQQIEMYQILSNVNHEKHPILSGRIGKDKNTTLSNVLAEMRGMYDRDKRWPDHGAAIDAIEENYTNNIISLLTDIKDVGKIKDKVAEVFGFTQGKKADKKLDKKPAKKSEDEEEDRNGDPKIFTSSSDFEADALERTRRILKQIERQKAAQG